MQLLNAKLKCKYCSLGKTIPLHKSKIMGVEKPQSEFSSVVLTLCFCQEGLALELSCRDQLLPKGCHLHHCSAILLEAGMGKYSTHSASLEKQLLDYSSDQFQNNCSSESEHRQTEEKSTVNHKWLLQTTDKNICFLAKPI